MLGRGKTIARPIPDVLELRLSKQGAPLGEISNRIVASDRQPLRIRLARILRAHRLDHSGYAEHERSSCQMHYLSPFQHGTSPLIPARSLDKIIPPIF